MTPSTDFTTLGRLGTTSGGTPRRRPVRRAATLRRTAGIRPVRLLGGAAAALLGVAVLVGVSAGVLVGDGGGVTATSLTAPQMDPALEAALRTGDATQVMTGSMQLTPGGGSARASVIAPPAFAAVDDVALHLPLAQPESVLFMEADNASALPMVPIGQLLANGNPGGFAAPEDFAGPGYAVAPPRSGVRPATGMAALLTAPGTALRSPVQGVVTSVEEYTAEDGTVDWKVGLQPQDRPDLQVVLRRIATPSVVPGQEVTVGVTEIGTVRGGRVVAVGDNPLSLPAALLHVRPATMRESEGALQAQPRS